MRRLVAILVATIGILACGSAPPGPHPQITSFTYDDWTSVLERFVDDRGLVDYEGLARDRAIFDRFIKSIETVSPRTDPDLFPTRNDAFAYYINAYNVMVFKGVLDRGPEKESVWSGLVSGLNFFVRMKIRIGGQTMSLKSLEDSVIRGQFKDPRVHAALNCASLACPRLPREAFLPERLDEQLDAAMKEFINEDRNCHVDREKRTVTLSKIFDWYSGDFIAAEKRRGNDKANVLDYINRYRRPGELVPRDYRVVFLEYDKRINAQ
ncbi:MAG: DUF547 domain-containing protein [Acidobacteriota bacterium]